jgi:hypothetical protein
MLPACRTDGEGFAIPMFEVVPSDVEGFIDALWEFQSLFHDCFARREPRAHFFAYMVGQLSQLERKSIEPLALHVEGGTVRGLQRRAGDAARAGGPAWPLAGDAGGQDPELAAQKCF